MRTPRIALPDSLPSNVSTSDYDRLVHTYGKSYADMVRMCLRDAPTSPTRWRFRTPNSDIVDLLDWAGDNAVAVIPFGGGTSVCGGVEADVGDDYRATLSLDLQYLARSWRSIATAGRHAFRAARSDRKSRRAATAVADPALTSRRAFSFRRWAAGSRHARWGHFASVYTHIDDFVESTRSLRRRGVLETRRLPGSGAGPSPDRMMLGSEGTLGIITEAWMRLQDRPVIPRIASVTFPDFDKAVEAVRVSVAVRSVSQQLPLLDPAEAHLNRIGNGRQSILVLGFESADHPLDAWMDRALELLRDYGGQYDDTETDASGAAGTGAMRFSACPTIETSSRRSASSPIPSKRP